MLTGSWLHHGWSQKHSLVAVYKSKRASNISAGTSIASPSRLQQSASLPVHGLLVQLFLVQDPLYENRIWITIFHRVYLSSQLTGGGFKVQAASKMATCHPALIDLQSCHQPWQPPIWSPFLLVLAQHVLAQTTKSHFNSMLQRIYVWPWNTMSKMLHTGRWLLFCWLQVVAHFPKAGGTAQVLGMIRLITTQMHCQNKWGKRTPAGNPNHYSIHQDVSSTWAKYQGCATYNKWYVMVWLICGSGVFNFDPYHKSSLTQLGMAKSWSTRPPQSGCCI